MKNLHKLLFALLLILRFGLVAQINCIQSTQTTGCTPFATKIEYCGPLQTNGQPFPVIYDYGDGKFTTNTSYTYTTAGLYSVFQKIAFQAGTPTDDSLFVDFFRVVSTPSFTTNLVKCKNKSIKLSVDSTSYDYYAIRNNINSDLDTILYSETLIKSFAGAIETEVEFTITGKYHAADCETVLSKKSNLIDEITPSKIDFVSEYQEIQIQLTPIPGITHHLFLLKNNSIVSAKEYLNETIIQHSFTGNYDQIKLSVEDQCLNTDTVLSLHNFSSKTDFANNQNTINHTSVSYVLNNPSYIKLSNGDTIVVASNTDSNIICGANDCYLMSQSEIHQQYNFIHTSTGNCGTSFSIDKPIINLLDIDNSNPNHTLLLIDPQTQIKTATVNGVTYNPEIGNTIKIPYSTECQIIISTNICNQLSDSKTICPLVLTQNNQILSWNATVTNTYNLYWIAINGDTNLLEANQIQDYFLDPKNYIAQDFCVIVRQNKSKNTSNTLCFEDYPLVFVPELVSKSTTLDIKTKFIPSYTLKIYDLNGNLVRDWKQNENLSLQNLDKGTYFYIFEGISEKRDAIHSKGSILLKD